MALTIKDIRQKYPQYNDLSDQQLGDLLHKKYYSDMPKEEFNKKIGLTKVTPQDASSNKFDLTKGWGNNTFSGAGDIRDAAQSAAQSLVNAGAGINQLETGLVNKALGTKLQAPDVSHIAGGGTDRNTLEANLARGIGSYLPYAMGAEVLAPEAGYAKLAAQGGAGAASSGADAQPNQENLFGLLPKGRGGAALEGMLANLIGPGMLKGAEKARPANIFKSPLTESQLKANLEATQGTTTGLGDVIGNRMLKQGLETFAPQFPMTGATGTMVGTANQLRDKAASLISRLGDSSKSENPIEDIQKALQESHADVSRKLADKKKSLNDRADELSIKVPYGAQSQEASDILDEINLSPELKKQIPSKVIDDLNDYKSGFEGPQTLKEADISKSNILNEKQDKHYRDGDKYLSGIYGRLKKAKQKDIDSALNATDDPKLKGLRNDFRDYYKNEYAPFEDKNIKDFLEYGKGDPDLLLNSFLKRSPTTDRSVLLDKLMSKIPQHKQSLVPYAYYTSALNGDGTVNLGKLRTLHEKLGKNQADTLHSDKGIKKEFDNLIHAIKLNPEPLKALANPSTGARNLNLMPFYTASAGASAGGKTAGIPGVMVGALSGLIAPPLALRASTKALTSESLRNSLVKEMLKNRTRIAKPGSMLSSQLAAQALLNQKGAQ